MGCAPQCTLRGAAAQHWLPALYLLQLGVTLDEFFCAPARETDREASILVIAFDAGVGADPIIRVTNLLTEKGIRVGAASGGRARKRARAAGGAARPRRRLRLAAHAPQKFFR